MKRLLSLGAVAALAACTSMAPRYERPAAPVASTFPNADALPASGTAAADTAWRTFYSADPRLQRLIAIALQNNRDLRVAVLNIEQARATARLRDAELWPVVSAGISNTRQPTASGGVSQISTAGVQVTAWEADFFGRIRSTGDAAAAQLLASEQARNAVQIALVSGVATSYLALQADDELLRVTQQTLATRQDTQRLIKLRFDNGASSALDLRAAESLLEQARVSLAQQTRQRLLDRNALVLLLGQDFPADLPMAPSAITALPDVPAGLPSDVLTRRPDVRAAELQLQAATASIGAARAAYFPRITLTASAGSVSGQLSNLFKAGSFGWSLAPLLLQPLFDAGRNDANLNLAETARDVAVAQYEKAVQSAFREVADALAGRATLQEQLRAQAAQVQAEQSRYELTDLRYRNGASAYLDVLDAQRSLFAAQIAQVQVQSQVQQNAVALYRVMGGGWNDPCAEAARTVDGRCPAPPSSP